LRSALLVGLLGIALHGCSSEDSTEPTAALPAVSSSVAAPQQFDAEVVGYRTVAMTNVAVSATEPATFEQIHLVPGEIVLRTTSRSDLLACPGGWWGVAVTAGRGSWGDLWLGEDCIAFNASAPATLPSVATSGHYAIAVLSATEAGSVSDLLLSYPAGDESQACFVAQVERRCG